LGARCLRPNANSDNIAASEWLASKTGTSLLECPGTHLAYCQRPREVADAIGPFLPQVAASR